jgi:putative two-component system response regulator
MEVDEVNDDMLKHAGILVVDDQEANVRLVEALLRKAGYANVHSTTDSRQAVPMYEELRPDIVILDLRMPHLDGFEVMEALGRSVPEGGYLPILVLTADDTRESMYRALSMGARDFLTKPIDGREALLRIRNLLETRLLHKQIEDQSWALEEMVRERTRQLSDRLESVTRTAEHRQHLLSRLTGAGSASADAGHRGGVTR